ESGGRPGAASEHPTRWDWRRRPLSTSGLCVVHQTIERRVLLGPYAVQIYHCGVDVPQVNDFGFLIPILVKDRVGTDKEKNADAHHQWAKDLHIV
uniref:Uncharacterized protein n=2 Tax=Oryzias TaxID=8089 RepID=A0A3B3HM03_ORYLA